MGRANQGLLGWSNGNPARRRRLMPTRSMIWSAAAIATLLATAAPAERYDFVVYGATAAGVTAAVAAAREGLNVALLEPGDHVGGMVSGGLSWSDVGREEVIGGMALEFAWRVGNIYKIRQYMPRGPRVWAFEPHVAERVFREMLSEAGVRVYHRHRLREHDGIRKSGMRLLRIITENGAEFEAKIFADCTYEGDLMAQAGVSYTWGREGQDAYGETLAGVRERNPKHQFTVDISPYDEHGQLLPLIQPGPRGQPGSADKKVQAYNFRVIVSSDPGNRVPFPKPRNYDPKRYELLARLLAALEQKLGRSPVMTDVLKVDRIPNNKADINNNGAVSTDYIGGSWDYPEASYRRREQIWQEHMDYVQGILYFLANDPRVPKPLRDEMSSWGLAADEFVDTNHWPHQLYIREARRMIGEYVMTQKDLQTERTKPDVICLGSYNSDSHNVQRIVNERGFVENEGDMQVPVEPYQIPYRVMLPKRSEMTNLLVPVALSASHVAYSSLRMEPQFMMLGHAAGIAAALAAKSGRPVQEIDVKALQAKLLEQGAVFEYVPSPQVRAINKFQQLFCGPPEARHGFTTGQTLRCP